MTDEQLERILAPLGRIATAFEQIAAHLTAAPEPPIYEDFEPARDDGTNPEILATIEQLEEQGVELPDEVYTAWGLEVPDRKGPGAIDESTFDLPQQILTKYEKAGVLRSEPTGSDPQGPVAEPPEPAEPLDPAPISAKKGL